MKSACFSLLAIGLAGTLAFGQGNTPKDPKDPVPKVGAPGADPKDKPPETPKLPVEDPILKEALKHYEKNEIKECMAKLKEATDKNKELQPPEIIFASWLVQSRKGSDARMVLEQFIARNVDHPDGYLLNASFAYGEGRITDAIYNCLAALDYARRGPKWNTKQVERFEREGRLGLVACLEARGDFQSMHEHLQSLVNADRTNAALRQRLAAVKFNIGQEASALSELEEAYKLDPAIDPPELRMGALWASKPATDLGLKPDEKPEVVAEAVKKKIAENRTKADEQLKKAVEKYPANPKAHRGYASFLLEEGKTNEALTMIDQAKAIDEKGGKGESRETTSLRALYHRYKGEYKEAVALFEKLNTANPSDPFANGNLAICLMETGERERATGLANLLVKSNEKSAEAYAVLGWVLFRNAREEKDEKKAKEGIDAADAALGKSASGGQAMLDTAYYLAEFFNFKKEYKKAYDLLKDATGKKGAFVYRPKAETLMNALKPLADKEEADKKAKDDAEKNKPKP